MHIILLYMYECQFVDRSGTCLSLRIKYLGFADLIHLNTHTDINQCAENNGGCAQQCTNLVPGFECSCNPGYWLGQDGTCSGKLNS